MDSLSAVSRTGPWQQEIEEIRDTAAPLASRRDGKKTLVKKTKIGPAIACTEFVGVTGSGLSRVASLGIMFSTPPSVW